MLPLSAAICCFAVCFSIWWRMPSNTTVPMVKVDVQQRDGQAVIHVTDTGRGIPQEFWQSIFQPFFRVDKSLSRELGGAGLGLPLVWEIARLHGGRVWVEKSNDSGSVLAVTLPLFAPITDTVRG